MAPFSYSLIPNADDKNQWTLSSGVNAWALLDDDVDNPNASDEATSANAGDILRVQLTTQALGGSETTVGAIIEVNCLAPSTRAAMKITLMDQNQAIADQVVPAGTDGKVRFVTVCDYSQAQVDALRIMVVPGAGTGTCRVRAIKVTLETNDDIPAVANRKLWQNRSATTGLSLGVGPLGQDLFVSCDLGGGKSFVVNRDSYWATAAGQRPILLTNPGQPGAPGTVFLRNYVQIINGYNIDTCTITSFAGAGNTNYFPDATINGQTYVRWPQNTFLRAGRLFVVGMLETTGIHPIGRWVAYCDDWSSNPTNPALWTWTYPRSYGGGISEVAMGAEGMWDNSGVDGYVYLFDAGTIFVSANGPSIARMPAAQFQAASDWRGQEWWDGASGWVTDRPGTWTRRSAGRPQQRINRRKRRVGTLLGTHVFNVLQSIAEGTVIKAASDGKFVYGGVPDASWIWDPLTQVNSPPFHFYTFRSAAAGISKFAGAMTEQFILGKSEDWVYLGNIHQQLTFTGAGGTDCVGSYNLNYYNRNNGFDLGYQPRFVRLRGVK